jgi:hypothetical protein
MSMVVHDYVLTAIDIVTDVAGTNYPHLVIHPDFPTITSWLDFLSAGLVY